ncbi:MAG: ABC transporter permease [Planctomycetota bacterium]|jgi:putative ABC transport system permease protein
MGTLWQDIKYGFRMLLRNPGFTIVVVLILAIGIGATTTMLSVVDAVMLRACPYKDPDRLVCIDETNLPERTKRNFTSLAGFRDWCEQQHVFEYLVGADQWTCIVRTPERAEKSKAMFVSEAFFTVLGAEPALGRTFLPEDYETGAQRVIVLSHDHWHHWFGGDPNAIGKTMTLNDQVFTVVGVLPEGFRWVFQSISCGLWMPLSLKGAEDGRRDHRGLQAVARLKPGVSAEQAQAEMDVIAERLAQTYPETNKNRGILVVPISEDYARMTASAGKPRTLTILLTVVISVLLIACLHVASLMIARAGTRETEIAVRAALGAHRLRLMRQLLTESMLLGLLGGLFGAVLAYWGLGILSALRGQSIPWYLGNHLGRLIPWFVDVQTGARSLFYATTISLSTCVAFGLLPALGASRTNLNRFLSAGRTSGQAPRFHGLRASLVVLDIAIALMLLVGAGLMVNSYARIMSIDLRYNAHQVLTTGIAFDWRNAPEPQRRLAVFREAVRRIEGLPGVHLAAVASDGPVTGSYSQSPYQIEGLPPGEEHRDIPRTEIWPNYFRVLQVPLLQGRYFTERDDTTTSPVVIVNEAMARRFWPGEHAIGKHITSVPRGNSQPTVYQVVGVVGNVWHSRYLPDEPELYIPYLQSGYPPAVDLVIRTASGPKGSASAIRRELTSIADDAAVGDVALIRERIADLFSSERFNMLFLGAFAVLALFLASIGVYGTTAYTVSRRTQEIGIRMALGARGGDVLWTVLWQGLRLTCMGVALGLAGAVAATRLIRSLLYDISPTDPLTFVCVSLLLAGVAPLATYVPARRASRIDPMQALRYE